MDVRFHGEKLQILRRMAGLSQDNLAERSGVARGTIADLELEKREPQGRTLRKLADALAVEVEEFYRKEPYEDAPLADYDTARGYRVLRQARQNLTRLEEFMAMEEAPDEDKADYEQRRFYDLFEDVSDLLFRNAKAKRGGGRGIVPDELVRNLLEVFRRQGEVIPRMDKWNEEAYGHLYNSVEK